MRKTCPLSVIPDTEKVVRGCPWDTPSDAIKKRLDFLAFEDTAVDHGVLPGVTAGELPILPPPPCLAVIFDPGCDLEPRFYGSCVR